MTYTAQQKHAIDCVLSIFETGKIPTAASYATCTILADGAGISYGKHQCTDRAGSLDAVVKRYIALGGQFATAFKRGCQYAPVLELVIVRRGGGIPVQQRRELAHGYACCGRFGWGGRERIPCCRCKPCANQQEGNVQTPAAKDVRALPSGCVHRASSHRS